MGIGSERAADISIQTLWDYVLHGSPTVAALALVVLDRVLNGKISELKNEILKKGDKHEIFRKNKVIG